jgi:diguanylate cyclase (GGDEF)-like protein
MKKTCSDEHVLRFALIKTSRLGLPRPSRLIHLLVLLVAVVLASASLAQQYSFQPYRQSDGLASLNINSISFDKQGFLWVATENGVYRFLGQNFQRFGRDQGLPEEQALQVLTPPDGTVWVASSQNLYRWDGESFHAVFPKQVRIYNEHALAWQGPGRLLVAQNTQLTLVQYDQDGTILSQSSVIPDSLAPPGSPATTIGTIGMGSDGSIWMSCHHQICSFRGDTSGASTPNNRTASTLKIYGPAQGVPDEVCSSILNDGHGNLWVVTQHHVLELPSGADRFLDRSPPALDSNRVFDILPLAVDASGRILISAADGIARWDGADWQRMGPPNGLHSSHISALAVAPTGDLWLGSMGHGLNHWIGYNNWEGWTDLQGLPSSNIWSLGLFDTESAFIGTEKGPASVDLHTSVVTPFFPPGKWTYGHVKAFVRDARGIFWVGTQGGDVLKIDRAKQKITTVGKLPGYIFKAVVDPAGDILFASAVGIYRVHPQAPRPVPEPVTETDTLLAKSNWISSAVSSSDNATLWFVARYALIQFSHGQWTEPSIQGFPAQRPQLRFLRYSPTDKTLWGITNRQVWHLVPQGDHLQATQLQLPPQYSSFSLFSILADDRGWIWLGTDNGLLIWNGNAWRHFTQNDGLIWNDTNGDQLALAPDRSVWIGTSGGLSHVFHPETLFQPMPLGLSLLSVRRGGVSIPMTGDVRLRYAKSNLEIQFATPTPFNHSDLQFHYRLDGLQNDWIVTDDSNVGFLALAAGSYNFQVYCTDVASGETSPVRNFAFMVLPPWWQSGWFVEICILSVTALLLFLYSLRMRQLIKQREQLEEVVRERTAALEATQRELLNLATHDGLTGLYNRSAVLEFLYDEMERARRESSAITIVLVDIDHFKQVNDTYGHLVGDEVLRRFSAAISQAIRPYDHAGRYGGEEFLIVLPGAAASGSGEDDAKQRLSALHSALSKITVPNADTTIAIQCSMGATSILPSTSPEEAAHALAVADRALYTAKNTGRNRFVYSPLTSPEPASVAT